jgi:hypothetical protein
MTEVEGGSSRDASSIGGPPADSSSGGAGPGSSPPDWLVRSPSGDGALG